MLYKAEELTQRNDIKLLGFLYYTNRPLQTGCDFDC